MTLNQIKYFITAAECLNFHQAAQQLFVTQQVVSKQIKALENETGILLFERNHKNIRLTEAGEHMYKVWKPFVEHTQHALTTARSMQGKRKIRIGLPDIDMLVDRVLPVLEDFSGEHEEIDLDFTFGTVNQLKHLFEKKELDLWINFAVDLMDMKHRYYSTVLKTLRMGVICYAEHPITKIPDLRLYDLRNETLCIFDDTYAKDVEKHIREDCAREGFQPKHIKHFSDWRSMELAIYMGKGVSIIYDVYFSERNYKLAFCPLKTYENSPNNDLVALWHDNSLSDFAMRLQKAFMV